MVAAAMEAVVPEVEAVMAGAGEARAAAEASLGLPLAHPEGS